MKKALVSLTLLGMFGFLVVPGLVLAQDVGPPETCTINNNLLDVPICSTCTVNSQAPTDTCPAVCCLVDVIETVGNWVFYLLLAVALIMVIYGAFLFVTAGGNEEQTGSARKVLIYALIGVAIAYLSRIAVTLAENLVT